MKLLLLVVGKTDSSELDNLVTHYCKRIEHYLPFEMKVIPDVRRSSKVNPEQQKQAEGREILTQIQAGDRLILLDERGKSYSSIGFARELERCMLSSYKRVVLLVGGAYGFSPEVYERADERLSLSSMTFSHQMVRLFIAEQVYRAMTILRGEPYHHE